MTKILPLLIAGAIVLAGAETAHAETFCVGGGIRCEGTSVPSLQAALLAAQAAPGRDEIVIGGTGAPLVGPFVYPIKSLSLEPVEIRGVRNPVLTAPPGETVLDISAGTIDGVDILTPPDGTGMRLIDSTVRDVSVRGHGAVGVEASSEDVNAERLQVEDADIGVLSQDDAHLRVVGSRISAARTGVASRGLTSLASSVVQTTGANGDGVSGSGGGLDLDHVTVAGGGDAALELTSVDIPGRANIQSSVFAGYSRGVVRDTSQNGTPYPLAIRDSVWDNGHDQLGDATSGPFKESGDVHVDPQLVGGNDLRLRGGSAAIDRDTLTDGRYTDVDGVATVGARADAGAFEYRRRAPSIDAATVPGTGDAGAPLAFAVTASDPDGDHLQVTWAFDDGAVASGAQAAHAFAKRGVHAVTLRVRDEAGLEATRAFSVAIGGGDHDAAPVLSDVKLSKRRASLARAGKVRLRFTVSEAARVRVVARGRAFTVDASAGENAVPLRRLKIRRSGKLAIAVRAVDAAGNRSQRRVVKLAVR
ncbi:MAG TPA: PKD domain-containing protein [Solirubrobacteraceae bacterium]|nr:PKD domain-containing protein [Solirubrobacteraceae bacterium]